MCVCMYVYKKFSITKHNQPSGLSIKNNSFHCPLKIITIIKKKAVLLQRT